MTHQIVDICDIPHIISNRPLTWYKWYCNLCGSKGKTTNRGFQCHDGRTRITVCDEVPEW
jgi:hypothetical protein